MLKTVIFEAIDACKEEELHVFGHQHQCLVHIDVQTLCQAFQQELDGLLRVIDQGVLFNFQFVNLLFVGIVDLKSVVPSLWHFDGQT